MGLFDKLRKSPGIADGVQLPERLAQEAELLYGNQRFAEAAEKYAEAIDRIDTMCYAAQPSMRIRTPHSRDQQIFDGLNSSLGAAMSLDPLFRHRSRQIVEMAVGQLYRVSREPGVDPKVQVMYDDAIHRLQVTLRLA